MRTLAQRYVEEGLRMDEHPLVRFVDGPAGRRARLVGTGMDVWGGVLVGRGEHGGGGGGGGGGVGVVVGGGGGGGGGGGAPAFCEAPPGGWAGGAVTYYGAY